MSIKLENSTHWNLTVLRADKPRKFASAAGVWGFEVGLGERVP